MPASRSSCRALRELETYLSTLKAGPAAATPRRLPGRGPHQREPPVSSGHERHARHGKSQVRRLSALRSGMHRMG